MSRKSMKGDHSDEHPEDDGGADKADDVPKRRRTRVTFEEPEEDKPKQAEPNRAGGGIRRTKSAYLSVQPPVLSRMSMEPQGSNPHRPALNRASMPMLKVLDKKHQAYLEKERHDAEHLMSESHEHDSPACGSGASPAGGSGTPKSVLSAGAGAGQQRRQPSGAHGFHSVSERESVGREIKKMLTSSDEDTPTPTGTRTSKASPRPTMEQVAELFRLSSSQKALDE